MADRPLPVLGEIKLADLADQIRQWAETEVEPVDGWYVTDVRSAEFAARILAENRQLIEERRGQAQAWHAQIDEWYVEETRLAEMAAAFAEHKLELFALHHRRTTGQATLSVPSGKVRTGTVPGATVVVDEEAFVEWAVEVRPDAIRTKHEPIADVVKTFPIKEVHSSLTGDVVPDRQVKVAIDPETGEIVPGLGWRPDRVWVKM